MKYLNPLDEVDFWRKKTPADWYIDITKLVKAFYKTLPLELQEDIITEVYIKAEKANFPHCVDNYPDCKQKKVLNYLHTMVRHTAYVVLNKWNKDAKWCSSYGYIPPDQILIGFGIGHAVVVEILSKLSPIEQGLLVDCLTDPLTWHKNNKVPVATKRLFRERMAGILLQYSGDPKRLYDIYFGES